MDMKPYHSLWTNRTPQMAAWSSCTGLVIWMTWSLMVVTTAAEQPQSTGVKSYCAQEVFNASCPANHVIIMTSALYGRMDFGRCMKENHGHRGCQNNVLALMDQKCSGRNRCAVQLPLTPYIDHPNCPSELISYLEADYSCQPVEAATFCPSERQLTTTIGTDPLYLLPPQTTLQLFPGSQGCPWVLTTDRGRHINVTIVNFSALSGIASNPLLCQDFLLIDDNSTKTSRPLCSDQRREKLLYLSQSHALTLNLRFGPPVTMPQAQDENRYLLKVAAVGCSDVPSMPFGSITRTGDVSVVKCDHSGETFFLSCSDNEWHGELHNCSKGPLTSTGDSAKQSRFPYGLLIVIGIGVALGVALGIILLAAILTCFRKKKHNKNLSQHTSGPLLSEEMIVSEDANSNYYERRSIATTSRSPHAMRDPTYAERAYYAAQGSTMRVDNNSIYASRKMNNLEQNQQEIYCTCPKGVQAIYGKHTPSTIRAQTSFITFKPESEAVETVGLMVEDNPRHPNADTRSLDIIRETECQNMENMQRASFTPQLSNSRRTACIKCELPTGRCLCKSFANLTMPRLLKTDIQDVTMINNKSV